MSQQNSRRQQRLWDSAQRVTYVWVFSVALAALVSVPGVAWAAGPATASAGVDRGAERGAIDAERHAVAASFDTASEACQGRFLLNQCLDEARTTRRLALDKLQRRQLLLDDAERHERSAQRLQALQARARELAPATAPHTAASQPASAASPASRGLTVRRIERTTATADLPAAAAKMRSAVQPSAAAASAQAQAQRRQAAYQQRQQQSAAHRNAVLERNARQDASAPPAAGLPVPTTGLTAAPVAASASAAASR